MKKPSIATQLKGAKAEVSALTQQVEKLTKGLADKETSLGYARSAQQAAESELEQIHSVLDALPGAIERKGDDGYSKRPAMTRLAAWFATRAAS